MYIYHVQYIVHKLHIYLRFAFNIFLHALMHPVMTRAALYIFLNAWMHPQILNVALFICRHACSNVFVNNECCIAYVNILVSIHQLMLNLYLCSFYLACMRFQKSDLATCTFSKFLIFPCINVQILYCLSTHGTSFFQHFRCSNFCFI